MSLQWTDIALFAGMCTIAWVGVMLQAQGERKYNEQRGTVCKRCVNELAEPGGKLCKACNKIERAKALKEKRND